MPGVLACVYTKSAYGEGTANAGGDQHIAIKRSTDGGATWGSEIDVEPAASNTASWGVPYYDAANDVLYVFYTYNADNFTTTPLKAGGTTTRVDTVGVVGYRTSTDKGQTWSSRSTLTVPSSTIDSRNAYSGSKIMFWLNDIKAKNGKAYLSLSKVTDMAFADSAAFIAEVSIPPSGMTLLPSNGLVADSTYGATTVTEESTNIIHSDGLITMLARTDRGYLFEAWSTDGGSTFTKDWARLADGTTVVANPRGSPCVWELPDGRFLLWSYNNTGTTFSAPRNPVWLRTGKRVGNRIVWSGHLMLTYSNNKAARIGYPSMVVDGTDLVFAASDKGTVDGVYGARLMRVPISSLPSGPD